MRRALFAAFALIGAAGATPAAQADYPVGYNVVVVRGFVTYDCFGCGSHATLAGTVTYDFGSGCPKCGTRVYTEQVTAELTVDETYATTGTAQGALAVGDPANPWPTLALSWTRTADGVTAVLDDPSYAWTYHIGQPQYLGAGALATDIPAGGCGHPLTTDVAIYFTPALCTGCTVLRG